MENAIEKNAVEFKVEFENNNNKWILAAKISMWLTILYFILIYFEFPVGDFNSFFLFISVWSGFFWYKNKTTWTKDPYCQLLSKSNKKPWWIDWTAGIFPLVFIFFLVRGFIAEPFKIPSGSMEPLFVSGDIILVNKFHYDFKIPVWNKKIAQNKPVQPGDVIVFKYPPEPNTYYVKRAIGIPGDTLEYIFQTKELIINNKRVEHDFLSKSTEYESGEEVSLYTEKLNTIHTIQLKNSQNQIIIPTFEGFLNKESCTFNIEKMTCKIPMGYYFAMGDNRDNSLDSRFWGFVPENNIIGQPQAILLNFHNFKRFKWF